MRTAKVTGTRWIAKVIATAAIAIAGVVGRAHAQDTLEPVSTDDRGVTNYSFTDGSDVSGVLHGPDGATIPARLRDRRDTLVHPRVHYIDSLLKSVESL